MGLLSLEDITFYKELLDRGNRGSANAIKYAGILQPVAADTNYLLEHIKVLFPAYPGHDVQHSYRILDYLSCMLNQNVVKAMSDTELFCLIMTALFHDTGMALHTASNANMIRDEHHKFSTIVLDKYFDKKLPILQNRDRLKSSIAFACEAHGMAMQDLYSSNNYKKRDKIDSDEVRYAVLSSLIRIGDLMDLDSERVNEFVLSYFSSSFSDVSLEHNIRHLNVQNYYYSESELNIEVLAENVEQFRIWSTWIEYINNEILYINSYLSQYNICFPIPSTKINKAQNANFEVEEIRFEIDDSGGMWKILSQSIYTDELDFLRELVQNAIDATLLRLYLNPTIKIDHVSPKSWDAESNCEDVFIGYSETRRELFVLDSGVGMNQSDLKRFLFKVTGSGYSDFDKRPFAFPSIAKFGIGFVSCLINANDIEIFTKKHDEETTHHVSLAANNNLAITQNISVSNITGTAIRLKLKREFSFNKIQNYLDATFLYPSVGITCVNIDHLEKISNLLYPTINFTDVLNAPYSLRSHFLKLDLCSEEKKKPYDEIAQFYRSIFNQSQNLRDWINQNETQDKDYSDAQKFADFKSKIQTINKEIKLKNTSLPTFPFNIRNISEKELFNDTNYYLNRLTAFIDALNKLIKENDAKRYSFDMNSKRIKISQVSWRFQWKYCVCELNNDFQITSIEYGSDAIDLTKKSGILFLYHESNDPDEGYEYAAVNGFLFCNGEICRTIARFTGHYKNRIAHTKSEKVYIVGYQDDIDYDFDYDGDLAEQLYNDDIEENEYESACDPFSIEELFSAIVNENNTIVFLQEVGKEELRLSDYPLLKKSVFDRPFDFFNQTNCPLIGSDRDYYPEKMNDIYSIGKSDSFIFCQDGIRFNSNPRGLFPIGFFKMRCNLTANSRLPLNVTRHKFSEIKSEIEPWITNTALSIQNSVLTNVKKLLADVSLDIDIDKLIQYNGEADFISEALIEQFKQISSKKH